MSTANTTSIKRLYIGNLDESMNEYAIVQLFKPFGKIIFIEVMIHHTGVKKGTPRGFCFLEFETKEQSLKAIHALNGKTVKGRNLVVSFAHMTPEQEELKKRRIVNHTPTQLSLMKGHQRAKNASTEDKIKAIERKLAALKQKPTISSTNNSSSDQTSKSHRQYKPY